MPLPSINPAHVNTTASGRQVLEVLDSHRGRFVRIEFVKRTTGQPRVMLAIYSRRYNMGPQRWDNRRRGLIYVYDVQAGKLKRIALDSVTVIVAKGRRYSRSDTRQAVPQPMPQAVPVTVPQQPARTLPELRAIMADSF